MSADAVRRSSIAHTEPIGASAEVVWGVVGAFGDDSWMNVSVTCEGEGVGAVRTVSMPTGDLVERCERHDPASLVIGYTILGDNPFGVTDYYGELAVEPVDGATCRLTWTISYSTAVELGPLEDRLRRFAKGSVCAVKRHVEEPPTKPGR